MDTLIH